MKARKPKRLLAVLLSVLVVAELIVSVVLGTVAQDSGTGSGEPATKTVTKQLIDFSGSTVATDIRDNAWPEGIEKMDYKDYKYKSTFQVDIAEDADGEKFLKFNFDQRNTVGKANYISGRKGSHDIYVKVSIPYWYIYYLKDIQLDYLYNYSKTGKDNKVDAFYILGVSDGEVFGKANNADDDLHEYLLPSDSLQTGTNTKSITDLGKMGFINDLDFGDGAGTFTAATQGFKNWPKWTKEDLTSQTKLDVVLFFSPPEILYNRKDDSKDDTRDGYYFGIKGISVTLEGPTVEIDNVDNEDYVTPGIVNFEEASTIEEIADLTPFNSVTARSELVTDDVHSGTTALLYKRWKESNNPDDSDSNMRFKLERSVTRSQGITFMAKNISDTALTFRMWISPGNAKDENNNKYASKGKYQYVFTLPANMTEYQRISIYWNNVGLMSFANGGEWWGSSSSGHAVTDEELASGISLQLRNSKWQVEDAGALFDSFEYITKQFTTERTVTLVDFSNCVTGTELPENVTVGGNYEGSAEIIENSEDGTKALRLNYDAPAEADTKSEMHHLRSRDYFTVSISVPRGSMDDLSEIAVDMTNNRTDITAANGQKDPNTALYNIGIADSTTGKYGKTSEINDTVNFVGNTVVTKKPVGMRKVSAYHMTAWTGSSEKWAKEDLKNIDTFVLYISAPDCDGTEGESFQLNSITLMYNEPPEYNEEEAREIVHADKVQTLTSGKITAKSVAIGTVDPNSSEFRTAIEVNVKDAANTERLVLKNELTEFHRNLTPFYNKDTATFHMFAFSENDTKFQVALIDKNRAELTTEVEIAAATTKLYTEASVKIKEIYDAAIAADENFAFDMTDIRAIAILPVVEEPTTFRIAGATILTGEYLSSVNDTEKQKTVNLVNFDNCEVGTSELPSNVTVSGYAGTKKIVRTADGSNALQINYDKALTNEENGEEHQTNKRTNVVVNISVPEGSLEKLNKVTFTLTNNGYALSKQNTKVLQTYLTMAVRSSDSSIFVKQGESATRFNGQKGVTTTVSLQVKDGFAGTGGYNVTSWMNKNNCVELTDENFTSFDTVTLYIAIPDIDGTLVKSGMNFQINSIDLEFEEKPAYNETYTRLVANGESRAIETTDKDTLTVTETKLASNNINYRTFKKYYTLNAKKGNTAPAVVENSLSKFLRNAETFLDTATFRMYYQTTKDTKAQVTLVNANGERLPFEVKLEKSSSDKYDEVTVALKDIYEDYFKKNSDAKFSLADITAIEILPLSSSAIKINVASPGLWSKEAGSASSAGNYYYALEDDSARVEAYNYNIADDYTTTIEYLDIDSTIAANGTRLPEGATVIKMVKVSLRNGNGELTQPTGRFWVSFRLPEDVDLNYVKMYEMFYDGSLVEIKHVVMDANNYISCEDYFASKTYAILSVPPVEEEEIEDTVTENTAPEYIYEVIVEGADGEVTESPTQQTVIKRYKKKKKATEADYTWLWILIIVAAVVVLLVTGLIIFFIIRKKRKDRKENVTV